MAVYTAEQLSEGVLVTDALIGETNFNFTFPSSLSGSAYFTFETLKNSNGSYANVTPLAKGDKEVGANSLIVIKPTATNQNISGITDDFIWSAEVRDGGNDPNNVITWTPETNVGVGTAFLRGTGGISVNVV
jgi:hypothetical protein|tara:strand:- start:111 stop:506 length:396 start_codon:yes stop_codon:yes gene_type:complete